MPGPLLTVTINESARRGFKAGPLIVLGHAILELTLVVGLMLGLRTVFQNPLFTLVIGIVGGTLLLWMGFDMIKNAWRGTLSLDLAVTDRKALKYIYLPWIKTTVREKGRGCLKRAFFLSNLSVFFMQ